MKFKKHPGQSSSLGPQIMVFGILLAIAMVFAGDMEVRAITGEHVRGGESSDTRYNCEYLCTLAIGDTCHLVDGSVSCTVESVGQACGMRIMTKNKHMKCIEDEHGPYEECKNGTAKYCYWGETMHLHITRKPSGNDCIRV